MYAEELHMGMEMKHAVCNHTSFCTHKIQFQVTGMITKITVVIMMGRK